MPRVVVPPAYLVRLFGVPESVQVPARKGAHVEFAAHGRTFSLRRLSRDVVFLRADDSPQGRFGTEEEIADDVAHVLETGRLPRSAAPVY